MASSLDALKKLSSAQMALVWLAGCVLLGAGWYYVFYADVVDSRKSAEKQLGEAQKELGEMEKKEASFKEDMFAATEAEKQIEAAKLVLPMNAATVDHLMRKFQHEARLVGLTINKWTPGGESKSDFYARLPIKISARATWHQASEFFRRVSEMTQIVNVEGLTMKRSGKGSGHPTLALGFTASTFRFLTDKERGGGAKKRKRRRK